MTVPTIHLVATVLMGGVIAFVQVVHYPLMERVGTDAFVGYEAGHTRRTSWVVVPLMLAELGTAIWLAIVATPSDTRTLAYVGLGLLAVIWISTALLQGPAHARLSRGFDAVVHRRLVTTNWIRTLAWIARIPVAVGLMG